MNKEPLEFTSRNLSDEKLTLSPNVNQNFDYLSDTINSVMDEVAPRHIVKISPKRRFVEPWMSTSFEQSANKKYMLYKKMLQSNHVHVDIANYKAYRNVYNRAK